MVTNGSIVFASQISSYCLFPLFILLFVQFNKALPVQFSLVHSREFDQVKHEVNNNPSKANVLYRVLPTQRPLG